MVGIDLGDTIRYDPDVVEIFEQTICLIAVSCVQQLGLSPNLVKSTLDFGH